LGYRIIIDAGAANEPSAPSGSPDLASETLAVGYIVYAALNRSSRQGHVPVKQIRRANQTIENNFQLDEINLYLKISRLLTWIPSILRQITAICEDRRTGDRATGEMRIE